MRNKPTIHTISQAKVVEALRGGANTPFATAYATGLSQRTVQRALKSLRKMGLIALHQKMTRHGKVVEYHWERHNNWSRVLNQAEKIIAAEDPGWSMSAATLTEAKRAESSVNAGRKAG